jgi:hypothetical protein
MSSRFPTKPRTATPAAWLAARRKLFRAEKALMRRSDALAARRQALPWVKLDQDYTFDSPVGRVTLADLFAGRGADGVCVRGDVAPLLDDLAGVLEIPQRADPEEEEGAEQEQHGEREHVEG